MWWREDLVAQLGELSVPLAEDLVAGITRATSLDGLWRLDGTDLPARPGRVLRVLRVLRVNLTPEPGSRLELVEAEADKDREAGLRTGQRLASVLMADVVGPIFAARIRNLDLEVVLVEGMAFHPSMEFEAKGIGRFRFHFTEVDSADLTLIRRQDQAVVVEEDSDRCLVLPASWRGPRLLLGTDMHSMLWCSTTRDVFNASIPAMQPVAPGQAAPVWHSPSRLIEKIERAMVADESRR